MSSSAHAIAGVTVVAAAGKLGIALSQAVIATDDSPKSIFAQAGVFAVALAIAWWMLKRSDTREAAAASAARKETDSVRAELATERRDHQAVLVELATLRAEITVLRAHMTHPTQPPTPGGTTP